MIIPFEPLWEQYKRIIKDNGAIVLTASQPFTSALVMSNPEMFKYEWIWDKKQGCNFNQAPVMPLKTQENILVFSKATIAYNSKLKMNYFPQGVIEVKDKLCKARSVESPHLPNRKPHKEFYQKGTGYPIDILVFPKTSKNIHPTQKPVALFEYLINTYTNEGDTVLDNCAGSGTTAIAAININRNYILIEKDEKYFQLASERIRSKLI